MRVEGTREAETRSRSRSRSRTIFSRRIEWHRRGRPRRTMYRTPTPKITPQTIHLQPTSRTGTFYLYTSFMSIITPTLTPYRLRVPPTLGSYPRPRRPTHDLSSYLSTLPCLSKRIPMFSRPWAGKTIRRSGSRLSSGSRPILPFFILHFSLLFLGRGEGFLSFSSHAAHHWNVFAGPGLGRSRVLSRLFRARVATLTGLWTGARHASRRKAQ